MREAREMYGTAKTLQALDIRHFAYLAMAMLCICGPFTKIVEFCLLANLLLAVLSILSTLPYTHVWKPIESHRQATIGTRITYVRDRPMTREEKNAQRRGVYIFSSIMIGILALATLWRLAFT